MIRIYVKEIPENSNKYTQWKRCHKYNEEYRRRFNARYKHKPIFENITIHNSLLLKGNKEHYFETNRLDIKFINFIKTLEYTPIGIKIFKDPNYFESKKTFKLNGLDDVFIVNKEISKYIGDLQILDFQIGGPFHQGDFDNILVTHIMDAPIKDIIRMSIREEKLKSIRKWAKKKNLQKPNKCHSWPDLGRSWHKNRGFSKFDIGDGIHRIQVARELGLTYIKAIVGEVLYLSLSYKEGLKI